MTRYEFSNVNIDESCIGIFAGSALPNQFSMTKNGGKSSVTVYMFNIQNVSEDGIEIINPMDSSSSVIPLEQIVKIKSLNGNVIEVFKYESITKEEVVKYFMETDDPQFEAYIDKSLITCDQMRIHKGKVVLVRNNPECDLIAIEDVTKLSTIKLGK